MMTKEALVDQALKLTCGEKQLFSKYFSKFDMVVNNSKLFQRDDFDFD